jgi:hypothetical protein
MERMEVVKKFLALVLLAGFVAVGVVGCGSPTSQPKTTPTSAPPKETSKP